MQVIARGEGNPFRGIQGLEHQLFNKRGNVAVTDDAKLVAPLRTGAGPAWPAHVNKNPALALRNWIRDQAAADRDARG